MNNNTPNLAIYERRIATARAIGASERKARDMAAEIVGSLPDDFDPSARGAIAEKVHAYLCGPLAVPAQKIGERTTDYGRGVNSLTVAVKRGLASEREKFDGATVTIPGVGCIRIPREDAKFAALTTLIGATGK